MKDVKIMVTGDNLYIDQHLSDLLCVLTCEQDRQRTAQQGFIQDFDLGEGGGGGGGGGSIVKC